MCEDDIPTYKELLQDYKNAMWLSKYNGIVWSSIGSVLMITFVQVLATLAKIGLNTIIEQNSSMVPAIVPAILFATALDIATILLCTYIFWHFMFVFLATYQDEINLLVKKFNVYCEAGKLAVHNWNKERLNKIEEIKETNKKLIDTE
jgi:hypothetical protein